MRHVGSGRLELPSCKSVVCQGKSGSIFALADWDEWFDADPGIKRPVTTGADLPGVALPEPESQQIPCHQ
jgi:hypothetical protein